MVNLQEETKRVRQKAEEKLSKVKNENKQYNLLLQVTSCFSNVVTEYTYFTEQWFSDDNNDVVSKAYGSAMYAYSEEFWLDDHELENANPYLSTEKNIEKTIIDTMTMNKSHYLNFYENLRRSHASWDNSIGYQLAFHTVKSYKAKIQKDLEQELTKIQNLNPQNHSEQNLIDQRIVSQVYTNNQVSYEPIIVTSKKNKQEVTPKEYNNFKNLRQLLKHLNELNYYMDKRVQFFLDKLETKVHIQSEFDKEVVRRRFKLYIERDELMQSVPKIFKWYDIPRLKNLRKKQWKDLLFEETKNLAKRYYNYLIKKEQIIIQLKKLILNAIASLCIVFDIWILYQTLVKKQPIPTEFLNPKGQNLSTLQTITLFIVAIMLVIVVIMFKNEITIKHKEKIQTLPETFKDKYSIDPIN